MGRRISRATLVCENDQFADTRGVSQNCRQTGFVPAFQDRLTGETHTSVWADGSPASIHLLDGLPEHWVISRDLSNHVTAVRDTIVSGFLRDGEFFTREEMTENIHS